MIMIDQTSLKIISGFLFFSFFFKIIILAGVFFLPFCFGIVIASIIFKA